ncbi:MAG: acetylornithine transaminase [Actinobacteria bacterium]|nr:acetylornithine transaminase [Actinomycetota bacterium]
MMATYRRWPVEMVAGSGCRLTDSAGRSYLDFVAGIAVASVGHAHPRVTAAVTEQAARLVHVSNLYVTRPQAELAARLGALTHGMLSFFTNSGAEAVECALKLARKWGKDTAGPHKSRIIATNEGFHGRTLGALAATGQPAKQRPFAPMLAGFTHVDFGDGRALAEVMGDDVAAVLLEPIQGEAGAVVPPEGYLRAARSLCDDWKALLVLDEVQTGIARTGAWFAHQHEGVRPDVMCLAKGLGGGLPIGACLADPGVAATLTAGDHGSTFGGGPVQCAAALAVLETISSEGLVERAAVAGERLMSGLRALPHGGRVRGKGLLIGVAFEHPVAHALAGAALERGLLVNDATPHVMRLVPPLVISDDEIDEALGILEEVFGEIEAA